MTRKGWTLVAAILASGLVFLDTTVVIVALPRIGQDLPATLFGTLEAQSYIYNGYLLTLSALLILAGALSDLHGRRRVLMIGLAAFGATSVLCGLAPNMEVLVASRLLQGAAGAIVVPGSLAIITATFAGEERGRAFGIWASASALTTLLGPPVGGVLVDVVSWRSAFLVNVPIVLIALYAALRVRESRDETAARGFDLVGAALVALGVGGLTFGAVYGQQREWRDPLAFVALAIGAAATLAFPFAMARRAHPLVPLALFRSRNFSVTNLSTFLVYGALYVSTYVIALFQQGTLGYTAFAAGLAGAVPTAVISVLSPRVGALAARVGPRRFMAAGAALMAAGLLYLARVPADSAPWLARVDVPASWLPSGGFVVDFLPGIALFAFGLALLVAPLTTALMASVPPRNAALASAINNAISRIGPQLAGAVIFIAVTTAFYAGVAARVPSVDVSAPAFREQVAPLNRPQLDENRSLPSAAVERSTELERAAREASTEAFHLAMLVCAGLLAAGAAVNLAIRDADAVGARDEH